MFATSGFDLPLTPDLGGLVDVTFPHRPDAFVRRAKNTVERPNTKEDAVKSCFRA